MLHKTPGIVFKFFRYGETSVIAKIFTATFGMQTYIINGIRKSGKGRAQMALMQPLTLLDLVVYRKENSDIQRISEMRCTNAYRSIPWDIRKSSMALFISEMLYKSVKEQQESHELFEFLHHSLEILDTMEKNFENFHLQFLMKLSRYLGFALSSSPHFMGSFNQPDEISVKGLLNNRYTEHVIIDNMLRRTVLDHILDFYRQHIDGLNDIKSVRILHDVL